MKQFCLMVLSIGLMAGAVAATPARAATSVTTTMGTDTTIIECDGDGEQTIYCLLNIVLTVLTVGVGAMGILGIVIAGVMLMTAQDNPEQLKKAKSFLFNVVIGLVMYLLAYAFIEWLIPGGVF